MRHEMPYTNDVTRERTITAAKELQYNSSPSNINAYVKAAETVVQELVPHMRLMELTSHEEYVTYYSMPNIEVPVYHIGENIVAERRFGLPGRRKLTLTSGDHVEEIKTIITYMRSDSSIATIKQVRKASKPICIRANGELHTKRVRRSKTIWKK